MSPEAESGKSNNSDPFDRYVPLSNFPVSLQSNRILNVRFKSTQHVKNFIRETWKSLGISALLLNGVTNFHTLTDPTLDIELEIVIQRVLKAEH